MYYIGVDLHKKSISICVVQTEGRKRVVVARKRLDTGETGEICRFFRRFRPFQVVVEATASYEWFVALVEPLAGEQSEEAVVLAHPKKVRVIAESAYKTDKIDARVLAELLAVDMIPRAHRPTPRQREHRTLVRYRRYVLRRLSSVRSKIRRILANYNADRKALFSVQGLEYLAKCKVSAADRFVIDQLLQEWRQHMDRLKAADKQLTTFANDPKAPTVEKRARKIIDTIPNLGDVTIDIVIAEVGDAKRITSLKRAGSFIGLAPGVRESAGKAKGQGITKEGSRLLRWAMIQAAWRMVRCEPYWKGVFQKLAARRGKKKAIGAVGRRVFCMIVSMLHSGEVYRQPDVRARSKVRFRRHRRAKEWGKDSKKARGASPRPTRVILPP